MMDQFLELIEKHVDVDALRLKKGDDFVDGLRDDFLAPYAVDAPLVHDPTARVLVFRRKS